MVEFDEERYLPVAERIAQITEEEMPEPYGDYFRVTAAWLKKICEYRQTLQKRMTVKGIAADIDEATLKREQQELYAPVLPQFYDESYTNPAYACRRLGGDCGGLLSMLSADLMSLPVWVAQGRDDVFLIFLELFVEVYGSVMQNAGDDAKTAVYQSLKETFYWFYHDYTEIFTADGIEELVVKTDGFFHRMIREADLNDLRYLYAYGYYVGENERSLAAYMNSLSEEAVRKMADTYTEGYRIGFAATQKDISKKKTVRIDYPLGMERMIRFAVENFEKIGLKPTFTGQAVLSAQGRGVSHRSVFSEAPNRQFLYDHKDDRAYYMDARYQNRRLEVMRATYETYRNEARLYGGPAVIEMFGEEKFEPENKPENSRYTDEQNGLNVRFANEAGLMTDQYIPGDEYSFTIIAFPYPSIGENFPQIFDEIVRINTLDYMKYRDIQQKLIDLLDKGEWVHVRGSGNNCTDMKVMLYPMTDEAKQTRFENCVADVNIPVGEVFTSPLLEGTEGTLFVSHVYLGDYEFKNLKISFADGRVTDYGCTNFDSEEENRRHVYDNILHKHKTLPIGEFAIGTNTLAYRVAKDYGIFDRLPILIAEKTGPHFAVGDTCYSHAEEVAIYNPDGKEQIARDNSCSILRKSEPEKAYFNCHTDITIPFEELAEITVVAADGSEYPIIRGGLFVAEGTEELNEPLQRLPL